ncbi:unnamed protein product, partial [Aureobasidium vineae]
AFEGGDNNQQDSGLAQDAERDLSQQSGNSSGNSDSNNSSGGGFENTLKTGGEDAMLNTEANKFLTKEGVPQGADGAIDGFVDQEANKFM